ncbi:MAG: response regulator [Bradymonadaceae bacterium]|nr:response regulator [Lujinxingiaceae bacterium]
MSQTVLVADDSRTIRKVVEMALKARPFEVVGVGSAREAMEAAQRNPSVIILDYYMPDGSGYDICRALKSNQATRAIPVIMLGGTYKNFDPAMARDCGAEGVVMKPFKTDDLIDAIEAVLSGSSAGLAPPPQAPLGYQPAPVAVQEVVQRPAFQSPAPAPVHSPASAFQAAPQQASAQPASAFQRPEPSAANLSLTPPPLSAPASISEPRIGLNPSVGSQPRIPSSSSQPRIASGNSQPRIAAPDVNASSRQRTPTPPSGVSSPSINASGSGLSPLPMNRSELENLIREEVKKTVRDELPALLRNVMGEVFQQKVLPKLIKHGEERIQQTLREELDTRITTQVRSELERLLSEE